MYYGLTFSSGNESLQVVMDTAGLRFYARATSGGVFGPWKLVCGGEASGGGDDVLTADRAEVANKAYQLAAPMTITFSGAVNGEVSFDGSTNVVANLTGNTGGGSGGSASSDIGYTTVLMATPTFTLPAGGAWFVCSVQDGYGVATKPNGFSEYKENVPGGTTLYKTKSRYNENTGSEDIVAAHGPVLCTRTA